MPLLDQSLVLNQTGHLAYHEGEAERLLDVGRNVMRDYGAAGDGATDDTAAIQQAALDASGGLVFFPQPPGGSYLITSRIDDFADGTTFMGVGKFTSIIQLDDSVADIPFVLVGKQDITFRHMGFDMGAVQAAPYMSIWMDPDSHNCTVLDVSFARSVGGAVYVNGTPSSRVNNLRVMFCDISTLSGATGDVLVPISTGGVIHGNTMTLNGAQVGYQIYECDDIQVSANMCHVVAAGGIGYMCASCQGASFIGNHARLYSTGQTAFKVQKDQDNLTARATVGNSFIGGSIRDNVGSNAGFAFLDDSLGTKIAHVVSDSLSAFVRFEAGDAERVTIDDVSAENLGGAFIDEAGGSHTDLRIHNVFPAVAGELHP